MLLPTGKLATGKVTTFPPTLHDSKVAPEVTEQLALTAGATPWLVQVNVPLTTTPGPVLAGNPVSVTRMSA